MLHRSSFFLHTVSLSLDAETVTTWRWLEWTSVLQCRLSDNISPLTMNEFAPLHCLDMPSVSRVEDVVMDDNVCAARLLYARKSGSPIVFRHEARVNFHNLENASLFAADPLKLPGTLESYWGVRQGYCRSSFLASAESAWTSKPETSTSGGWGGWGLNRL